MNINDKLRALIGGLSETLNEVDVEVGPRDDERIRRLETAIAIRDGQLKILRRTVEELNGTLDEQRDALKRHILEKGAVLKANALLLEKCADKTAIIQGLGRELEEKGYTDEVRRKLRILRRNVFAGDDACKKIDILMASMAAALDEFAKAREECGKDE